MASLTRKKDCKNWIAVFTLSTGSRTNRSTGTADKKEAQRIANEFEKAEQDAKAGRFGYTKNASFEFLYDTRQNLLNFIYSGRTKAGFVRF